VRVVARHPAGLLALDKPAGLIAHPNRDGTQRNTLLNAPYALAQECYYLPHSVRLYLLNRIDSPTSGLVLAATDPVLAAEIREIFKPENRDWLRADFAKASSSRTLDFAEANLVVCRAQRTMRECRRICERCPECNRGFRVKSHHPEITKIYYAVVKGTRFDAPSGHWRDALARRAADGHVRVQATRAGGIPALTHYEVLATTSIPVPLALLRLTPKTGRTHQLRVQCATRAHPIIGDKTYGDFALNRRLEKLPPAPACPDFRRLFLHAHAITLVFKWKDRSQTFTAASPLPQDFTLLFKNKL
jgi:23S rRNA-/tRNA-specific pseudouridylate synthase